MKEGCKIQSYLYMLRVGMSMEKGKLVKGGYLVEVVGRDKKKVIWGVVGDHVVEDPTDYE